MHLVSRRKFVGAALLVLVLTLTSSLAFAQYTATTLVKNTGKHGDKQLINPWGLDYGPGAPFWLGDQGSGLSTLYDGNGVKQSLVVTIPPASGTGLGSPTGVVYNSSTEFKIMTWTSAFLFCTLDGTISGWSHFEPNNALIGVNNSALGAVYTGLAVTHKASGNFVYAADFANNKVDVYDGTFKFAKSFTDTALPAGFAPLNVQDIGGQLYVAFAAQSGAAGGYIDIYNEDGTFVKTLIHGKPLNQPFGFAMAPSNFGPLSNTLLISNNTNSGTINGFDPTTGALVGTIRNAAGKKLVFNQIWGIEFGGGTAANGNTNQLFYTAGPKNNLNGVFGVINAQ
ncbi:MAG: TIGR03118 family protein [Acidobacteriia bacterium]|nr:TIGR03118 family protein [Terriglobia bacterium]